MKGFATLEGKDHQRGGITRGLGVGCHGRANWTQVVAAVVSMSGI